MTTIVISGRLEKIGAATIKAPRYLGPSKIFRARPVPGTCRPEGQRRLRVVTGGKNSNRSAPLDLEAMIERLGIARGRLTSLVRLCIRPNFAR